MSRPSRPTHRKRELPRLLQPRSWSLPDLQDLEQERELDLIPVKEVVLFPHLIIPLLVGRERSVRALERALEAERGLVVVTQKDPSQEDPARRDLHSTGTYCSILQALRLPDGGYRAVVQGIARVRIQKTLQSRPAFKVLARTLEETVPSEREGENAMQVVMNQFRQAVELGKMIPPELVVAVLNIEDPGHLADVAAFHLDLSLAEKQALLETVDVADRLHKVSVHLSRELEILKIENRIQTRAEREMEKGHREYFLRQQLKAIQEELGHADEEQEEVAQITEEIRAAEMPEDIQEHALRDVRRLERMSPASPERSVIRTCLDWMVQFPWNRLTEDRLDLAEAQKILEEDHYGLEDVKERILEFLAVRKLKGTHKGPILCFVGPPGVGKTSLGRSIARALGREFNRTSLGGVRDEAEIRGHRRTYVGALPGRIIQALCTAGSRNPVIVLDEIDKVGNDFRGDPSAALLEALDPEQNHEFKDHYLAVPTDLSSVMFILTANVLDTIPPALRDRMEVIRIPGYTEDEKVQIATGFLIPRQRQEHGLKDEQFGLEEEALRRILREYTREAGVRNLEREIARLCRKRARQIVEARRPRRRISALKPQDLPKLLGVPRFRWGPEDPGRSLPGAARGLSWTQAGGELLTIEASLIPGRGRLVLTGSLGQVMKESARAALSWVRSHAGRTGLDFDYYKNDFHLHVPEGAIPKDGPSAGVTMACAFLSVILDRPVRWDVAMTGEITLRGRVMPVGGIKEKVLAAHNSGIFEVILPAENARDLEEIPDPIRKRMHFTFAEHMEQVLEQALPE